MAKRSKKHRPPTKRQREITDRFKWGDPITRIAWTLCDGTDGGYAAWLMRVEQAIRACLVWEGRDER